MIPDWSSPSRVRCAASRPGLLRADLEGGAVYEGKGVDGPGCGVASGRVDGPKGNLSVIPAAFLSRSRGALSPARAVAQRRRRAGGLTHPLAEAIRGFDSGFGGRFCCRSACPFRRAVWYKSLFFQFFTYKEGFGFAFCGGDVSPPPPLPVVSLFFSASYPQARRSYYLFFSYLFFNYMSVFPFHRRVEC